MKKLLFASLLLLTLASCEKPSDYTLKIEYFSINKEPDTVVVTGRYDNNVCRVETYREATPVFTSNGRQYLHVSRIEILDKQP